MKKLKHEKELVKEAIIAGVKYAEERGAALGQLEEQLNQWQGDAAALLDKTAGGRQLGLGAPGDGHLR